MKYLNQNGLANGKIIAGIPCPWRDKCYHKTKRCPDENNILDNPYSCATARLFSCIEYHKTEGWN
jgi:hypothetical protein